MSERGPVTVGTVLRVLRTPVTLLVLLAVLGLAAWWGFQRVTAPIPPRPPEPCVPQSIESGRLQASQISVQVLNGGSKRGLAGDVAHSLRDRGFTVTSVGNLEDVKIEETVIVAQDKDHPETKLVAAFFPKAKIREEPGRIDRSIDILVGNKFGGFNGKAKTSIGVKAATVCLPAKPSPTIG